MRAKIQPSVGRRGLLKHVPLGKARIQSLADCVFAISMSALIFFVKIPDIPSSTPPAELLEKIGGMLPGVFWFLFTFMTGAALWYLHHLTFHFVKQTNQTLIWLNLVFLGFVAALPLCSAMLIRFPMQTLAHLLFFGDLLALGLMLNWHWYYAIRHYMVDPQVDLDVIHRVSSRLRILPGACGVALPMSLIRADLSYYSFIWVLLLGPFIERLRERRQAKAAQAKLAATDEHR